MSENIRGITFAEQTVTPADDAIVRRAILGDGILAGCDISYSGSTLTMAPGYIIACGRAFQVTAAKNWAVVDATSGVARLLLTLDMTKTSTEETFSQINFSIEYASAEDGFVDLIQDDINISGVKYQIVAAVVSLGTGGITGIVSKLEKTEGGGGLNFKVVPGLTQPGAVAENTIWVKTEKIPVWTFSVTEPENPVDGMVWFLTGTSSITAFNALKKNTLQVYPLSGKQYVDGAWSDVPVMIYQNGSWTAWWNGELFQDGDQFEAVTGGWEAIGFDTNGSWIKAAPTLEIGETMRVSLSKTSAGTFAGVAITRKKIDLTNWDTLTVFTKELSISKACEYGSGFSIFVLNSNDNTKLLQDVAVANKTIHTGTVAITKTDITTDLDVSTLEGKYYIAVRTTLAPKTGGSAIAADIANMLLLKSDSLLAVYRAELDAAYQEGVNSI